MIDVKAFAKYYLLSIGICTILCLVAFCAKGEEVLVRLATEQMIGIQMTILAINIPTICILLTNVTNLAATLNVEKLEMGSLLRQSVVEQLFYIVIGLASSVFFSGVMKPRQGDIWYWVTLGFALTWLCMTVSTLWDLFKSILIVDDALSQKS